MVSPTQAKIFPQFWYAKEAEEAARFYASIFRRFQAMSAGAHHEFNDAISMVVLCADQAELDRYWDALLKGGGQPRACGWLIDRYGFRWQIVPAVLNEMMSDKDAAAASSRG